MREVTTLCIRGQDVNGVATMENCMAVPQEIERTIIWSGTCGYTPKRIESRNLNRHLHSNFHGVIQSHQKMKIIHMPIQG